MGKGGAMRMRMPHTPPPPPREASNYDEVSMQQSLLFSESLKDLKNLRTQLYSAAEYFEMSYTNDDQKHIVVETLKDYAIKAIVNTVDHLGSLTFKVNHLLDDKVNEVSRTQLRLSCIHQRVGTCQEYIDREGISQQSLTINTPKYHKRYLLPVGETMRGSRKSKYILGCSLDDEDDWHQLRNAVRATIQETPTSSSVRKTPTSSISKGRSPSPSPSPSIRTPQRSATFSFTATNTMPNKQLEKRAVSPYRFPSVLLRSGSVSRSRPTTPSKSSSRPTTPTSPAAAARPRYPSEPRKSASMRIQSEKDIETVQYHPNYIPSSKSKKLLKSLLSRRKSRKDDMLYTYLDEY